MDSSLVVYALIIRMVGQLYGHTRRSTINDNLRLCAGNVAIESGGTFTTSLQEDKRGWIYTNNGAVHEKGRSMGRTW
jgi:hypothetical protein